MSFFGFDTSLPAEDKAAALSNDEERSLNDKIQRALEASAQEDVEVYTWGQDGYDGLGDQLVETNDDVNEDTFGALAEDIKDDFNFGHNAAAPVKGTSTKSDRNASAFAASLDDFWGTPSLSRTSAKTSMSAVPTPTTAAPGPAPAPAHAPALAPAPAPATQQKTLKEVESELVAKRAPPAVPSDAMAAAAAQTEMPRPLTLGEVEAQLLKQRRSASALQSQAQSQVPQHPPASVPPGVPHAHSPRVRPQVAMPLQAVVHPPVSAAPLSVPPPGIPLPGMPPMNGVGMPVAAVAGAGPGTGVGGVAPQMHHAPPAPQPAEVQAAHLARMRAMLEACPPNVQTAILSLPPPIQFDSLEEIVRRYPSLLRGETGDAETAAHVLTSEAPSRMEEWRKTEEKRRSKAAKLAQLTKHNGVMSGADKDFITRIQISHLVTSDPYTDDFYAHVFFALRGGARKVMVPDGSVEAIQQHKNAESTGKTTRRKLTRHENAMLRMQQQVERLVDNRKKREAKGATVSSLAGTLGRVSLVSATKPRQMLQLINEPSTEGAAPKPGDEPATQHQEDAMRSALKGAAFGDVTREPPSATSKAALSRRESLAILERLYHIVLQLEQMRREPAATDSAAQKQLADTLWEELRVLEPLGISDPHPFVSLLNHVKGKRLIPRVFRLLNAEQALTMLTMLVASFESLDAVHEYAAWEQYRATQAIRHVRSPLTSQQAADLGRSIDAFSNSVLFQMMALINTLSLRIISGMLALLMERNQVLVCAKTRPGVSLLSALLSRAEALRQAAAAAAPGAPDADELTQWHNVLGVLFNRLTADGQLPSLFYSTRLTTYLPFGIDWHAHKSATAPDANLEDEPVWNLMALLAIHADLSQQQVLVQELRDKILTNIMTAKEAKMHAGSTPSSLPPGAEDVRIRNVNLLVRIRNRTVLLPSQTILVHMIC